MQDRKVFIIGAGGMVGATAAYALAIREIVQEIVLIDINKDLVEGQAMDINDAMGFTDGVLVRTGDYSEIATDDIVVITGGAAQKPGQTRMELLDINAEIVRSIVQNVVKDGAEPFIIMVTNPVDVLTYVALKASRLPKNKVFGTGTTLDTARLKVALADKLHVSENEVSAYVLGEHGDSSFSAMSGATIAGIPLKSLPSYTPALTDNITETIRTRVYKIIDTKKSTYFGIGQVVAEIVDAMLHNVSSIFPVCSLTEGEYGLHNVVVGLPSYLNIDGVRILDGYNLSDQEYQQLRNSAATVNAAISSLQK
jgi:L-lactate dehydrogenase